MFYFKKDVQFVHFTVGLLSNLNANILTPIKNSHDNTKINNDTVYTVIRKNFTLPTNPIADKICTQAGLYYSRNFANFESKIDYGLEKVELNKNYSQTAYSVGFNISKNIIFKNPLITPIISIGADWFSNFKTNDFLEDKKFIFANIYLETGVEIMSKFNATLKISEQQFNKKSAIINLNLGLD